MNRVGFVRHGESIANAERWLAGQVDAPLTARGRAQAAALQPHLEAWRPSRILSSDLERAWQTAALAWPHPAPLIERQAALRERYLGAWERRPRASLTDADRRTLIAWEDAPPGGESQRALAHRLLAWLAVHLDARDTLIVAHGGVIRVLLGLLDGDPPSRIGERRVANATLEERVARVADWRRLAAAAG